MAGGIGITPMLSMAWRLAELDVSFDLHSCTRSRTRTAFRHLFGQHPLAGHLTLYLDEDPQAQRFDPARHLGEPDSGKQLYVCGPAGFMTYVIGAAERPGCAAEHLHPASISPRAALNARV